MVDNSDLYENAFKTLSFSEAINFCVAHAKYETFQFIDRRVELYNTISEAKHNGFIIFSTTSEAVCAYDIVYRNVEKELAKMQSKTINYGE